jgi:disulfide bond formation protein DsbB
MRSDYALYVIAVICFIVAIYTYSTSFVVNPELYLYGLVVLGLVFVGLGYMVRPKQASLQIQPSAPPPPPSPEASPKPAEPPETEPTTEAKKTSKRTTKKKRTTRRRRKKT